MTIIQIQDVSKGTSNGLSAVQSVSLDIEKNEIFALLVPMVQENNAIGMICGLVTLSSGSVIVDGYDNVRQLKCTKTYWIGSSRINDQYV